MEFLSTRDPETVGIDHDAAAISRRPAGSAASFAAMLFAATKRFRFREEKVSDTPICS